MKPSSQMVKDVGMITSKCFRSTLFAGRYYIVCTALITLLLATSLKFVFDQLDSPQKSKISREPQKVFTLLSEEASVSSEVESILKFASDDSEDEPGLEVEALYSIHIAKEMLRTGKKEKAIKLFEHALALAPKHPDVLNHYGEFIESTSNDLVAADQMYFKALTNCPTHVAAGSNRGRVAALVEEIDSETLRRIGSKRDKLITISETNRALRKAKKESYIQHIYHSVGIEGNTMTLSQTRSIVETRLAIGGKSIAEHNEILGLDAALKYINTTLINRIGEITIADILEIHKRVMGFVDPVEGGHFRKTQVFVGGHTPPPPSDIPPLMRRFENWLNSWEALTLHPVRYAAFAHYKLVHIHPFYDGNGRTSRLLMNTILMQAGYPPIIILKQDRQTYYKVIAQADEGDIRPFLRFIAECTERTLDLFLWQTSESEYPILTLPAAQSISSDSTFESNGH